ncbi:helix-turn-helix domain-containing protein [Xenorhabdus bovienii]|uniref:Helix-turn-helix domain-containing protein n=1 Tax=Xenorhabdus bovienii TaxID=40576 RepID=A0AAJ1N1E3_XENBV|nr:LexA family transcriptional regulator [Xenorhabdus bovienii]MDE1480670.1 helix-turn-helix domain-containing protein [Xenorhabdus bovienii]MDE9512388.1 helix-turn-helix domain-containing protein [Xenorhabdus bovienii]MDE9524021.1 helix-turn-helix domain-containing protein [Xenorhabdus bovienii]
MTLADRLKEAMKERRHTQSSLAEEAGMAQSMIWKLISGKATKTGKIVDIAKVLRVRPEWLSDGSGDKYQSDSSDVITMSSNYPMFVKIYEEEHETDEVFTVPVLSESLTDFDAYRAYRITQNTGCAEAPEGTLIVVDRLEKAANDDLVYARIGENYSVYRYVIGGSINFLSVDDSRVPLIPVSPNVEIVGVIVYLFREIKRRR